MPRKARVAVATVALFLMASVLTAVPRAGAAVDLPTWSVGDSWSYAEYGGQVYWEYAPLGPGDTVRLVVVGMETLTVGSVSYTTYHVEAWFNASGAPPRFVGDVWYRTSDLSVVRWAATLHVYGFTGWSNSSLTTTGNPPPSLRFPLVAGVNWTSATDVISERVDLDNGSAQWWNGTGQVNYSVGNDSTVTVPAGAFAVAPITEDLSVAEVLQPMYPYTGSHALVDFSAAVGNAVRIVNYDSYSGSYREVGTLVLRSYSRAQPGSLSLSILLGVAAVAAVLAVAALAVVRRRRAARPPPDSPPIPPTRPPAPPPGQGP